MILLASSLDNEAAERGEGYLAVRAGTLGHWAFLHRMALKYTVSTADKPETHFQNNIEVDIIAIQTSELAYN